MKDSWLKEFCFSDVVLSNIKIQDRYSSIQNHL
jgi:hypothetical protein